jgi:hypothetical protein
MKKLLLLAIALVSFSAQAGLPPRVYQEAEVTNALNVFAHNPEISQELKKYELSITQYFSFEDLGEGKARFKFQVATVGFSPSRKSGQLIVDVDYRPMWADASAEYKYEFKFKK